MDGPLRAQRYQAKLTGLSTEKECYHFSSARNSMSTTTVNNRCVVLFLLVSLCLLDLARIRKTRQRSDSEPSQRLSIGS